MGLFRDADEPVICDNHIVLVQNLSSGSKIIIYDIGAREMKPVLMKGISCFNVNGDGENIVFEFSGLKRGIGIINMKSLELKVMDNLGRDIILGGVWEDYIVFRRRNDIVLFDLKHGDESVISSCHHITGSPVVGYGSCAWLQQYRGKSCIAFCNIENMSNLYISSPGYINKMYLLEKKLVYQSCINNKCCIYTYDIKSSFISSIFESYNWIELYRGRDGSVVWTDRKLCGSEYIFDIWVYNVNGSSPVKILSDCSNAVIPAASGRLVLWLDAKAEGDSVSLMNIDI